MVFRCSRCGQTFLAEKSYRDHISKHSQTYLDAFPVKEEKEDDKDYHHIQRRLEERLSNAYHPVILNKSYNLKSSDVASGRAAYAATEAGFGQ